MSTLAALARDVRARHFATETLVLANGRDASSARAVDLPVTADLEAGYGLAASELVDRLFDAGAVGCNLEDADHHGQGPLLDLEGRAAYISAVCEAARARGVDLVVNARVDVYIRDAVPKDQQLAETLRRGHRYLDAGEVP